MESLESSKINYEEIYKERREELKAGFGVALCTKIKEGRTASFETQVNLAEEMNLSAVQFDFRNRDDEEIEQSKAALRNYRKDHHDVALSMHGETPKIDETNLDFKNKQRIFGEIEFLQEISGESYTVHPPSINQKIFKELPDDARNRIIKNYSDMFAQVIKKAFDVEKKFSIAIENMPVKGNGGAWGQSIEDILLLLKKVEQSILEQGVDPLIARGYVGATLDVNHALHDANPKDYKNILESWFKGLGDYLKVVHLYAPSSNGEEFEKKYELCLEFASHFNPNAKIFMESKQNPEVTKELYNSAKQIS